MKPIARFLIRPPAGLALVAAAFLALSLVGQVSAAH